MKHVEKCSYGDGFKFCLDGENEVDPCQYVEVERWKNVTVSILKCKKCGHIEICWEKQDNSEEISEEESEDGI